LHWEVARRSFRRWATYRSATAAGVFTNTVFGFIQAYVLLAMFHSRARVGGFDPVRAVTFVFVTQGLLMMMAVFNWQEIALRIRSGDVVADLYRPVDFETYWMAQDLGRAAFQAIFRGLPPFLLGSLVFTLRLSGAPGDWLVFLVALLLGWMVSFLVRFLVNLTAFWLLDVRGPLQIVMTVWLFLSGFVLPITFFPHWLEVVARASPFAAVAELPVEVLLGLHHGAGETARVLADQVAWIAILWAASRVALRVATRKVVIQGG
jgi:ABC-2 type transport system permease protein